MAKLTLADLASLQNQSTATTTINSNSALIEDALENTLSLDGTVPNQMEADLDMNSNRILNLPTPLTSTEPVRVEDLNAIVGQPVNTTIPVDGAAGTVLTKTSAVSYDMNWSSTVLRKRLTADTTYYVRTNGNDANTGLANTAGGAFLTVQKAWNVVAYTLDLNGFNVIIQIADGSYGSLLIGDGPVGGATSTSVTIQGNLSNNAAVTLTNVVCGSGNIQGQMQVQLKKFRLVNPGGDGLDVSGCGIIFDDLNFGACPVGSHINIQHGAFVACVTPYTVSGGALFHGTSATNSCLALHAGTITFSTPVTFSLYFLDVFANASIYIGGNTFVNGGTVTNTIGKALISNGGVIDISGASNGVAYLPGNGTVNNSGGVYGQTQRANFGNTNYTMLYGDNTIAQLASLTAPRTVTLIPIANTWPGYRVTVVDESGTATATNKIIVAATGGEFIGTFGDGFSASVDAVVNSFGSAEFESNGGTWTLLKPTLKSTNLTNPPYYTITSTAINFNSANTDTSITIPLPQGFTRYRIDGIMINHASASISTATCGVFSAAAAGGTALVTSGTAITVTTAAENTVNNTQSLSINNQTTATYTYTTLFFRVQTAQGSAATADVTVAIRPIS